MHFDPDAAAQPGTGIFGLPFNRNDAGIVLLPVPFDATTSYGGGTSHGPKAIIEASAQVDLLDHQFGRTFESGIFLEPIPAKIAALSRRARKLAVPIIARNGRIVVVIPARQRRWIERRLGSAFDASGVEIVSVKRGVDLVRESRGVAG